MSENQLVVVVDYGMGNLRSVAKIVQRAQVDCIVSGDASDILAADRLILPGVGAFGDGMANLRTRGILEPLTEAVIERGVPLLGICLGMELLASDSEEHGHHDGLGWIPGHVRALHGNGLRVPHVGWNGITNVQAHPIFSGIDDGATFYFTHSFVFHPDDPGAVVATCDYGEIFAAAVSKGHIFGCQFHPEKSQRNGGMVIHRFLFEDRP